MINADVLSQIRDVLHVLDQEIELAIYASSHRQQDELLQFLHAIASTSEQVSVKPIDESAALPTCEIHVDNRPVGVRFAGIPTGHELSSFVLAILYADGKGKRPESFLLDRVQRLQGPIQLSTYVSLSCESCPDVVQALQLMSTLLPSMTHTMVDGALVPAEIERLGIRGVPCVVANGQIISAGKVGFGELVERLEAVFPSDAGSVGENGDLGSYDVVVVGGGPAGSASAIYTARKGLKTAIVAERVGGQLLETRGIENMISVPYTEGPKLSQNLASHLRSYPIDILEHRRVERVERAAGGFTLHLSSGERLFAQRLVAATGARWRELGVPGERAYRGRGVAFCAHCDGPFFRDKDVVVVGGGNSGVEAAIDLSHLAHSVTLLEWGDRLKADPILVNQLEARGNIEVYTHAQTTAIVGDEQGVRSLRYLDRTRGEEHEISAEGVFVQIGLVPNSAWIADLVARNERGEIIIDDKGRTRAAGIYAAGDVTTVPYKQIVVALGEGSKAGLALFEDQLLAGPHAGDRLTG